MRITSLTYKARHTPMGRVYIELWSCGLHVADQNQPHETVEAAMGEIWDAIENGCLEKVITVTDEFEAVFP